jgi:hypothetical protein
VRFANRWIKRLTEEDPRVLLKVALAVRYLARVNAQVGARPGDVTASGVVLGGARVQAPAVNVEDRLAAEFTQEEVLEILKQAGFRSILPDVLKGA